ncbi:thioredoxin domain-containing protein [Caldisphaera lagunensis DSM 15908]|uniref:Thioredoxin domain-containing protein n=1 Tax=Caldisphaera lagunensis (strain DSM 15908 / JCM 11604 / ANMR 0165 / IC-154) TaxID=1056495 RepID=L0AAX0_CALLD|nr:thioredoxin family protein [Caldisphaera lagunensis]AFZ70170.1 thioredoxin domain-containing protein [Caldisphaera lagunensis DSM 15908]
MVNENAENLGKELSRLLMSKAEALENSLKEIVVEVKSDNFNEIINKNKLVFLFFTAEWCGPCISFLQTFREVASQHIVPNVFYGKVDVDSSYAIADKYKVKHIPSILIIVNGEVVDSIVGQTNKEKLENRISSYIKSL